MFLGDVQCVYCGSKINFSGNMISYQNQRCASHNKEHQFPGMNILVNDKNIHNSYYRHLPVKTQRNSVSKTFKHPNILRSRKTTRVAENNSQINDMADNIRCGMIPEPSIQTTSPAVHYGNTGNNK